jgi:hypothetical protein
LAAAWAEQPGALFNTCAAAWAVVPDLSSLDSFVTLGHEIESIGGKDLLIEFSMGSFKHLIGLLSLFDPASFCPLW